MTAPSGRPPWLFWRLAPWVVGLLVVAAVLVVAVTHRQWMQVVDPPLASAVAGLVR